jgi:hypothetical protein
MPSVVAALPQAERGGGQGHQRQQRRHGGKRRGDQRQGHVENR